MAALPDLPVRARRQAAPSPAFLASSALPTWLGDAEPRAGQRDRLRVRTVWISDFHLGSPGCNADLLLDFLKSVECETLYLVGDIIDMWRIRRKGWYWPAAHSDVVRCILKMAKRGAHVVYVPGNHDEVLRDYVGLAFGDVTVADEPIHRTADGRRLLVLHGDQFDNVVLCAKWLALLGDSAYELLLKSNALVNWLRRRFGLPYWSLAAHMKRRVKNAVQFISRFEEAVAHSAADRNVDGVVCGHIHTAEMRQVGSIAYYNTGDWVESCTALVEHGDGRMDVLDWAERKRAEAARPAPRVVALVPA